MKFSDVKLAQKLTLGFGTVVVVVAASSAYLWQETRQLHDIERVNSLSDAAIDGLDRARGDLAHAQSLVRKLILTGRETDRAKLDRELAGFASGVGAVRSLLTGEGQDLLPLLDAYDKASATYVATALREEARLAASPATHQQAFDMEASGAGQPAIDAMNGSFDRLRTEASRWSQSWTDAGYAAMDRMLLVVALGGILSTLLAGAMAWLIGRAIARPIGAMTQAMQALAQGDHSVAVPAVGQRDEIGTMARAVEVFKTAAIEKRRLEEDAAAAGRLTEAERARNAAILAEAAARQTRVVELVGAGLARLSDGDLAHRIDEAFPADYERLRADFNAAMFKLQDAMRAVLVSASAIRSGTTEISAASDDLSRRTEQQAASLEETAAALDEITATVRKTAEGSKHARGVVSHARGSAERSGEVVQQAVEAMSGIARSSREIGQIIGVIDEIAFQTNLLALNAGVEAARAGEAGRGFAVVASEVRGLAQRSAEAAREIKGLISTSGAQVERGVDLVGRTGEALSGIVAQVAEIDGIVGEIAASAQEQAVGLDQVNTAVNQMDQVTQQNAAMVEEATAAGQALARETGELARLIGRFRVGDAGEAPEPRATPRTTVATRPSPAPVRALRVVGGRGTARDDEPARREWAEF